MVYDQDEELLQFAIRQSLLESGQVSVILIGSLDPRLHFTSTLHFAWVSLLAQPLLKNPTLTHLNFATPSALTYPVCTEPRLTQNPASLGNGIGINSEEDRMLQRFLLKIAVEYYFDVIV